MPGRKGVKTRVAWLDLTEEMQEMPENAGCSSDASRSVSVAPTEFLKQSQEMKILEMKMEWQNEKINELRKERDYLKEQLASALKKRTPHALSHMSH